MHEQLLTTSRFTVERRTYDHGVAGSIVRDVVVHPGAVVLLPILADGRIVMIRQLRRAVGERLWELPAGTREPHEEPVETARRELIEETGYRAGTMAAMAEFFTSPGVMTELMHAFLATDLEPMGQRLERGEDIDVEALDAERVRIMLGRGELRDAKTMAVMGMYFTRDKT